VLIGRPIGRNFRNIFNPSADDIVTVARAVMDPESGEPLGVIMADMRLTVIENHIKDLPGQKTASLRDGRRRGVVYAPVNPTVYRIQPQWIAGGAPGGSLHHGAGRALPAAEHPLQAGRLEHGGRIQKRRGAGDGDAAQALQRWMLALIAVIVASVTAITFSTSFTKPISKLRMLMAEAGTATSTCALSAAATTAKSRSWAPASTP
jgi:two-component system sensor histidine kinase YesM